MSRIREEIEKSNLDLKDGEIKIVNAVNPTYANAIKVHKKKMKEVEGALKEKNKEAEKPFIGSSGKTLATVRTKDLKKMRLSERLFDDVTDDDVTSWKALQEKEEKDTWTLIYDELNGNIRGQDADMRRFKVPSGQRYNEDNISTQGYTIKVGADSKEGLEFAEKVAKEYGVEYKIEEHNSRYATFKFTISIYTDRPKTNESLEESIDAVSIKDIEDFIAEVKDRFNGAEAHYDGDTHTIQITLDECKKNESLNESANDVHTSVAKHFNYHISDNAIDVMEDLVERALDNENGDYAEDVYEAIDEGLIYNSDIWAIKELYEEAKLEDTTYEELVSDILSIVTDIRDNGVEESLTKNDGLKSVNESSEDEVTIDRKDSDFHQRYFELKDKGYKTVWSGEGKIRMKKTDEKPEPARTFYNEDLKVTSETDLTDFNFWAGAKDTAKYLTDDELKTISSILEDSYPDGMSATAINDFFWFEYDTIAEWLGYDSFEDLMEERDNKE